MVDADLSEFEFKDFGSPAWTKKLFAQTRVKLDYALSIVEGVKEGNIYEKIILRDLFAKI